MIPKHSFACLILLLTVTWGQPGRAAVLSGNDTTIGAMETKLFSHSYSAEAAPERISRLEKFVFGATSAGSPVNDRLSRLSASMPTKPVAAHQLTSGVAADLTNISSYPRVTQLELCLLGTSYFGEPIAHRLSRLEEHQFGQASTSKDLAGRMDVLTAIATNNAGKTRANQLTALQSPITVADNYRKQFYQDMQMAPAQAVKDQPTTVVDQIEYLECSAFGQKHANKTLQKRVDALEAKYYGEPKVADKNLTLRVAQLLSLVNNGPVKSSVSHG